MISLTLARHEALFALVAAHVSCALQLPRLKEPVAQRSLETICLAVVEEDWVLAEMAVRALRDLYGDELFPPQIGWQPILNLRDCAGQVLLLLSHEDSPEAQSDIRDTAIHWADCAARKVSP